MKRNFSFAGIFVFLICALLGVVSGGSLMATGTQANLDGAGVGQKGDPQTAPNTPQGITTDDTDTASPHLRKRTVDSEITKIRPCFTPIDTLLRSARNKSTKDMKFSYYSIGMLPTSCKANSSGYSRSASPVGTYYQGIIYVENTSLFTEATTIKCSGVEITSTVASSSETVTKVTAKDYIFYVSAVDETNGTLTVVYADGDCPAAAAGTADGTYTYFKMIYDGGSSFPKFDDFVGSVYRLGRAHAEGEKQTVNFAKFPTDTENYCQIFKWQVAASTLQQMLDTEVRWTMTDQQEEATVEFKQTEEASFLFGRKGRYWDNKKKASIYATGGIINSVTKTFNIDPSGSLTQTIDLAKFVFQGNIGNRKRIMLMGSSFNTGLSKMIMTDADKQVNATETKVIAGMEFEVLRTNFGQLYCMQYDLFDLYGWSDKALILDIDNIDKYMLMQKQETIKAADNNEFDGDIVIYTEVCGIAVKYPDTHCIVTMETVSA